MLTPNQLTRRLEVLTEAVTNLIVARKLARSFLPLYLQISQLGQIYAIYSTEHGSLNLQINKKKKKARTHTPLEGVLPVRNTLEMVQRLLI